MTASTKPALFNQNIFAFASENSILADRHLGISGTVASVLTPGSEVCGLRTLQACPFSATGFSFTMTFNGEIPPSTRWDWLPNAIWRSAETNGLSVNSLTVIPPAQHGVVLKVFIRNNTDTFLYVSLGAMVSGFASRPNDWKFAMPPAVENKSTVQVSSVQNGIAYGTVDDENESVIVLTSSLPELLPVGPDVQAVHKVSLKAHEELTIYLSVHIGALKNAIKEADDTVNSYAGKSDAGLTWLTEQTEALLTRLPAFSASDPALQRLYYRSLVTYITNRWENPELAISPWYSTSATNGGCMCSYLWDYSGGMFLHPLADPETHKKQLLLYLRNDLTSSYAIMPVDGKPCGPWYQINQEKIINMVYWYVIISGDTAFLKEIINGKTVAEWMVFHALVGDDITKPVALIDYGQGGVNHLELRHELQYRGIMPDLNARRYMNYHRAYTLSVCSGTPCPLLLKRAEELKPLLKTLWNEQTQWYDFIWQGKRESRMTVQMFKFLNSDIIDDNERAGLLSHLNDTEFLSEYGLHSISKTDPAYDVVDIDNGGGGICTEFDAMILGQLFDIGRDDLAANILSRILWWGDCFPYLGDSCAAYTKLQREDTPLQCDISSVSLAGMLLFNLSGISVNLDGTVTVCPPSHHLCRSFAWHGIHLRGITFDLSVDGETFTVKTDGKDTTQSIGTKIVLHKDIR